MRLINFEKRVGGGAKVASHKTPQRRVKERFFPKPSVRNNE